MKIETKCMGQVEISEEQVIEIPFGLFGFEEYTKFALVDSSYSPFNWLQSLEKSELAFLIIDPFTVCAEYETDIDDKELSKIEVTDPSQVLVMSVVTIPAEGNTITANLLGPLVINKVNHKAMQVILSDSRWTTKYSIMELTKESV